MNPEQNLNYNLGQNQMQHEQQDTNQRQNQVQTSQSILLQEEVKDESNINGVDQSGFSDEDMHKALQESVLTYYQRPETQQQEASLNLAEQTENLVQASENLIPWANKYCSTCTVMEDCQELPSVVAWCGKHVTCYKCIEASIFADQHNFRLCPLCRSPFKEPCFDMTEHALFVRCAMYPRNEQPQIEFMNCLLHSPAEDIRSLIDQYRNTKASSLADQFVDASYEHLAQRLVHDNHLLARAYLLLTFSYLDRDARWESCRINGDATYEEQFADAFIKGELIEIFPPAYDFGFVTVTVMKESEATLGKLQYEKLQRFEALEQSCSSMEDTIRFQLAQSFKEQQKIAQLERQLTAARLNLAATQSELEAAHRTIAQIGTVSVMRSVAALKKREAKAAAKVNRQGAPVVPLVHDPPQQIQPQRGPVADARRERERLANERRVLQSVVTVRVANPPMAQPMTVRTRTTIAFGAGETIELFDSGSDSDATLSDKE